MAKIKSIQSTTSYGGTTLTPTKCEFSEGDLLIVCIVKASSASDVTCTAGWTNAGAPYKQPGGVLGVFYKVAGANEAAPTLTTSGSAYMQAIMLSVSGHNGINSVVVSTVVTATNITQAITTTENDCLVLHFVGAISPSTTRLYFATVDPSTGYGLEYLGSTAGPSLTVYSRYQRTAGAVPQGAMWRSATSPIHPMMVSIAIRDSGNAIDAYPDSTTDMSVVEYWRSTNTAENPNANTVNNSVHFNSIEGLTIANGSAATAGGSSVEARLADTTVQTVLSFLTNSTGISSTLVSPVNLTDYLLVGRANASSPSLVPDFGTLAQRGLTFVAGEGSNYRAYCISATDANDVTLLGAQIFVVDLSIGGYASSGTINLASVNKLQFCTRLISGTSGLTLQLDTLYRVKKIVAAGGSPSSPITFAQFAKRICNAFIAPLIEVSGQSGMLYAPVQFGGGDALYLSMSAFAIQFPASSVTNSKATKCHVNAGKLGLSFNPKAGDVIKMRNSVISSVSPFHFSFLPTASASATYDFTTLTLVNAIVTLRAITTFSGMTFADCTIAHNGATVQDCSFNASTIITSDPSTISNSQFIGSDTVHSSVEYRVDIGAGGTPTGNWVRVDGTTEVSMIDWDGNSTGEKVTVTGGTFTTSGVNQTSGDFPSEVISDSKQTSSSITTAFTGLPPGMLFDVIIMSSRQGAGRHGKHTVTTSEYETFALKDGADNTTPFELTALVGSNGQLTITTTVDPAYPSDVNIPINAVILRGKQAAYPALKIITPGTYTLTDLDYIGYGANGSASAAIHNNSGGEVILNIAGGSTPTILNGIGATTIVQSGATVVVEGLVTGSRVIATLVSDGTVLHNGAESAGSVTFSVTQSGAIKIEARKASSAPYYRPWTTQLTPISGQTNTVTALQELDQ